MTAGIVVWKSLAIKISIVDETDVPVTIEEEMERAAKIRGLETETVVLTSAEIGRSTKNLEEALVVDALIAD